MAFNSLNTSNLPDPGVDPNAAQEPRDYFETFLYTGNGTGLQVGDVIKKPADTTTISNSLIFNDGDSAYLSRTPASAGNRKTWTWSGWVKRGNLGATLGLFSSDGTDNATKFELFFSSGDQLGAQGNTTTFFRTTQVFRDPSAWYHIVLVWDAVNTTINVYVNGVQVSDWSVSPTISNTDYGISRNAEHYLGSRDGGIDNYDGYMAEVHFVDGTAHAATDFGNFDANGIWIPKAVTGITYGTNGFYLDFSDNTSTTTLGEDQTANGNDWTLNNLATTDQVTDSPTNNHPILSNLGSGTTSEGSLQFNGTFDVYTGRIATQRIPTTGKYYWETDVTTQNTGAGYWFIVGMATQAANLSGYVGSNAETVTYGDRNDSSAIIVGNATTVFQNAVADFGTGDTLLCAYDVDANKFWFGRESSSTTVWFDSSGGTTGNPATGANPTCIPDSSKIYFPFIQFNSNGNTATMNFGQRTFSGTQPSGFVTLSENNITVEDQNLESPDFVWIKNRDQADQHHLYDSVRGIQKAIYSNATTAETAEPNGLLDFNKNGFTIGSEVEVNTANEDYVAWCWKANGATGVSNSQGTLTSTVSANTTSGFSIVKWTGDGTAKTIGHGLGEKPEIIFLKNTSDSESGEVMYDNTNPTYSMVLFHATSGNAAGRLSNYFSSVSTTTFGVGAYNRSNGSGDAMIAYCFHSVDGFSKFGSYTGNGSADGTFVYTGFKPAFVMVKRYNTTGNWLMYDSKVDEYNVMYQRLYANLNLADGASGADIDFVSNGFKHRRTEVDQNASNSKYIYMAFAETPFKYATAR